MSTPRRTLGFNPSQKKTASWSLNKVSGGGDMKGFGRWAVW
jgi:hypothetical protein